MSVIPLRISDKGDTRGRSWNVPGTVNIPYGHRPSQRGRTRRNANLPIVEQSRILDRLKSTRSGQQRNKADAQRISIVPGNVESGDVQTREKDEREYNSIVRTWDFEERTNKRILRKSIGHLVDEGMTEYENHIDARRDKLRRMIIAEEKSLMREIIDQAQQAANVRTNETEKRARELRELAETQRVTTVASKRMQQYLAESPEARSRLSVKTTRETKYSNLVQITENLAKRQADREVDELWYGLMLKKVEAMKAREIDEEKRRATTDKNVASTLEKQIAGKLILDEEEKQVKLEEREYLANLREILKHEESTNYQREKSKRAELKKDLEKQLEMAKRSLAERVHEEAAVERVFRELGEAELAREKQSVLESSSRLRKEIAAYMKSLEELRDNEAQREIEVENSVAAWARELETKRDLARQKERDVRERSLREVLKGREQQLSAKRLAREMENKRAEVERDLWEKENKVEAALQAEAETRRRENAARYGQELKDQRNNVEIMRQREKRENANFLGDDAAREREYEKLEKQMENAPEIITPHAFEIMLKECGARREAEQKGLCYCSEPAATTRSPSCGT